MLKIVNQTTYDIEYMVQATGPASGQVGSGTLSPGKIAAWRVDNNPANKESATNCHVITYRNDGTKKVTLDALYVPGNATVVFSTQILTGLLQPGS